MVRLHKDDFVHSDRINNKLTVKGGSLKEIELAGFVVFHSIFSSISSPYDAYFLTLRENR